MAPTELRGEPVAAGIRERVAERARRLRDRGAVPTLGTVLMSDAPADERFLALKHETCADLGIATRDRRVDPDAPAARCYETVAALSDDPAIDGVFVQAPLPDHVDAGRVRETVDPRKDVDCFHYENLGRLVGGDPRFVPATTAAVTRLLAHYDVAVAGRDVVVVGRSTVIGRPLANHLLRRGDPGDATVTVCHSRTRDLGRVTRRADVLVTAAGVPGLVDGSMLADGVVVVDVSANRLDDDATGTHDDAADTHDGAAGTHDQTGGKADGPAVVGDVDAESARERAAAITPVPGGVGPVTLAALCANVVEAADRRRNGTGDG